MELGGFRVWVQGVLGLGLRFRGLGLGGVGFVGSKAQGPGHGSAVSP